MEFPFTYDNTFPGDIVLLDVVDDNGAPIPGRASIRCRVVSTTQLQNRNHFGGFFVCIPVDAKPEDGVYVISGLGRSTHTRNIVARRVEK